MAYTDLFSISAIWMGFLTSSETEGFYFYKYSNFAFFFYLNGSCRAFIADDEEML